MLGVSKDQSAAGAAHLCDQCRIENDGPLAPRYQTATQHQAGTEWLDIEPRAARYLGAPGRWIKNHQPCTQPGRASDEGRPARRGWSRRAPACHHHGYGRAPTLAGLSRLRRPAITRPRRPGRRSRFHAAALGRPAGSSRHGVHGCPKRFPNIRLVWGDVLEDRSGIGTSTPSGVCASAETGAV